MVVHLSPYSYTLGYMAFIALLRDSEKVGEVITRKVHIDGSIVTSVLG